MGNEASEVPVAVAVAQPVVAVAVPMSAQGPWMASNQVAPMPPAGGVVERVAFTPGQGYTPITPAGKWERDCGDCCSDALCCVVICCPFATGPQLYQKVLGKPGSCRMYFGIMFTFYMIGRILQQLGSSATGVMWLVFNNGASLATLVYMIVGCCILMAARKKIREKDQIGTACCGECEDCCCAWWCPCCTTMQMFSQLEMSYHKGYQLCHEEGCPSGPAGGPQV